MEFRRKNIRLARSSYVGRHWYFLTACTAARVARFQDISFVDQTLKVLKVRADAKKFALQAYCFMPDHLHLLVSGIKETSDGMAFMNGFKQRTAYEFKQRTQARLWQHKSYDHILRPSESWEGVAYYIWMNPVRKGLCVRPEEWPFSGSDTVDWRRFLTPPEELWTPPWKS